MFFIFSPLLLDHDTRYNFLPQIFEIGINFITNGLVVLCRKGKNAINSHQLDEELIASFIDAYFDSTRR